MLYHTGDSCHTQIAISSIENHLYQLGNVNLFDILFPHKLNRQTNLLDCVSACDSLLKLKFLFFKKIVTVKSGYCTIMWKRTDHRVKEISDHHLHQRPVFIQRKWCCVYGGIGREFSIMSSFQKTKWLIPTSTTYN